MKTGNVRTTMETFYHCEKLLSVSMRVVQFTRGNELTQSDKSTPSSRRQSKQVISLTALPFRDGRINCFRHTEKPGGLSREKSMSLSSVYVCTICSETKEENFFYVVCAFPSRVFAIKRAGIRRLTSTARI